jgi:hypothetical protein
MGLCRAGDKDKLGEECPGTARGEMRPIAAKGMCFSCYRRWREKHNPNLAFKRRAQRSDYARRKMLAKKFRSQVALLDAIKERVMGPLRPPVLTEVQYGLAYSRLNTALHEIMEDWANDSKRQLRIIQRVQEIEERAGVPIVVDARSVVRRDQIPPEVLATLEATDWSAHTLDGDDEDLPEDEGVDEGVE